MAKDTATGRRCLLQDAIAAVMHTLLRRKGSVADIDIHCIGCVAPRADDDSDELYRLEESRRLAELALQASPSSADLIAIREVANEAAAAAERTHLAICGRRFERGVIKASLPLVPRDLEIVPDPYLSHVLHKPPAHEATPRSLYPFRMTTTVDDKTEETSELDAFRWIFPCHASRVCTVRFEPSRLGEFTTELPFGVWTPGRCIVLPVPLVLKLEGVCDVPRVHIREAEGQKELERLEFGPVALDDGAAVAYLHLVNGGAFPAAAHLSVETPRDAFGEEQDADVFALSLSDGELGVGEWQAVSIQAHPVEDGRVEGWLTCAVEDNPTVTRLPLSCIGAAEKLRRIFDVDVRPRTSFVDSRG